TALVHEAYLRLLGPAGSARSDACEDSQPPGKSAPAVGGYFNSRGHFFGAVAEAMRRILVEQARRKASLKQGGHWRRQEESLEAVCQDTSPQEVLDVDEALKKLSHENPPVARLVELRYFGGLTIEEAAGVIGVSERTARRYWVYAKAWLIEEL